VNRHILHGDEASRVVSRHSVSRRGVSRRARVQRGEPGGGRLGARSVRAALLCTAALGIALAAAPVMAVGSPALQFVRHDLDAGVFGQVTEGINVGDIDGDGRPDIVVGGDNYLVWFHNPDWAPNLIASGFKFAGGAMVVVRDIDGDGRLDVMTGKYPLGHEELRQTVWYGNTPSGWAEHLVSPTSFCHDLAFGDFDGDGHEDAVCDDQFLGQIVWLHGPASPTSEWTTTRIDTQSAMGAAVADIDRDGRPDVVAGRAWYRLSGGTTWSRFPYTTLNDNSDGRFDDFEKVNVLDLDGDGRLDVFATLFTDSREGQVYAFLAPPDPTTTWTAVQIDPGPLFGVHSQAVGAFDGTSRPQIMVGETNIGGFGFGVNPSPQIYVYRLLGAASDPAAWERTLVDNTGTHEARAIDLNGDGLPDLVGDEENTDLLTPPRNGRVSWWQNVTAGGGTATSTTVVPASTTTTTTAGGTTSTTLQVVLQPGAGEGVDTYLTGPANPDDNWGTLARAWVGTDERNAQRPLVRFTLGAAPAGTTVLACTLTVQADVVQAPLGGHVWRVMQPGWTEMGATWNRYDGTRTWAAPGGDIDGTSGIAFAPPAAPGPFVFPDLTALCRDAIAARGGQLDLLIQQDTETPGAPLHQWSFVTSDDTASPAMRPKLIASFGAGTSSGSPTSTPSTTTTSTTLPECGTTATFPSITCRLTVLGTRVELDVAESAFRANLLATLQGRVLKNVQQAESFATAGDRHRAHVRLGQAARGLRNLVRRLNSRRGRKAVPQSSGQPLGDEARAVRKMIGELASSL
jgi:VCBS repeat protein